MASGSASAQREWLTMIFLGADNDLFEFGDALLSEVKNVGSTEAVTVVAQRDPTDPAKPTHRGLVVRGKWDAVDVGLTGGDAKAVLEFVDDAKRQYPAEKKMLVLWDHGNGWQNVHAFEQVLSLPELQTVALSEALGQSGRLDVLCFDACLMAMIEIAYQLREHVYFMVASENVVPADSGWPYEAILCTLQARPEMTAEEVARGLVAMFAGAYNGSNNPVTLSALDLSHVEETVQAISLLSFALMTACRNGGRQNVLLARRYSQSFGNPDYIDLVSFCAELQRLFPGTAIGEAANAVQASARKLVIAFTRRCVPSISDATGLSIYFPDRPMSPLYDRLDFARRCGWASFLAMVTPQIAPPGPLAVPEPAICRECGHPKQRRPPRQQKPRKRRRKN